METQTRICQNCKTQFNIEPDDIAFYDRMGVSAPQLCPDCRFVRRALFRNERFLYTRKCDLCECSMVSMYHPGSPYTVYCHECWWSDKWNPYEYEMSYDASRPFFDQLKELMQKVPKAATYIGAQSANSDYTNFSGNNKDTYLVFNGSKNENVLYSRSVNDCRDSLDLYFANRTDRCYEGVDMEQGSNVSFSEHSSSDIDSVFLLHTSGCQNCFGCVNLRHGRYYFFNEKLSPEDYKKQVESITGSYQKTEEARRKFEDFSLKFPRRENVNFKTVSSTGNYLMECKNAVSCFECRNCENIKYCLSTKELKDSYDVLGRGLGAELLLDCLATGSGSSKVIGSCGVGSSNSIEYSFDLRSCHDCIGCDGIQNGKFVILNKRYSEEEYRTIREKIMEELKSTGEYGLFMPPALSPFAYNESLAQDNLPLTKEEATAKGYRWQEGLQMTTGRETLVLSDLPDNIADTKDEITKEILACKECGRNYRITLVELSLYRNIKVPLPRKCFMCRHQTRLEKRGPMKLFDRNCSKCRKQISTSYSPDRPEIVYCEQCYQAEVA